MTEEQRGKPQPYLLFVGTDYQAFGGANDYHGDYPTIDAAVEAFNVGRDNALADTSGFIMSWDWYNVARRSDMRIVAASEEIF